MKQQSANTPPETADGGPKKPSVNKPAPLPTVGAPLDGSQFQNIVEEQKKHNKAYATTAESALGAMRQTV